MGWPSRRSGCAPRGGGPCLGCGQFGRRPLKGWAARGRGRDAGGGAALGTARAGGGSGARPPASAGGCSWGRQAAHSGSDGWGSGMQHAKSRGLCRAITCAHTRDAALTRGLRKGERGQPVNKGGTTEAQDTNTRGVKGQHRITGHWACFCRRGRPLPPAAAPPPPAATSRSEAPKGAVRRAMRRTRQICQSVGARSRQKPTRPGTNYLGPTPARSSKQGARRTRARARCGGRTGGRAAGGRGMRVGASGTAAVWLLARGQRQQTTT